MAEILFNTGHIAIKRTSRAFNVNLLPLFCECFVCDAWECLCYVCYTWLLSKAYLAIEQASYADSGLFTGFAGANPLPFAIG